MKDDKTNIGTLFDIHRTGVIKEFTGRETLDQKKHYYAGLNGADGKQFDLVTSFIDHYETPHFEPTFNSTLAQWPLFDKYNILRTSEWFESLIHLGEESLANNDGDHDQDIRITKILDWARVELTDPGLNPFPEDLFAAQLADTRFNPIMFDSLSRLESTSASKSLLQFDQPKPKAKKKKKRKGSNRATAHRNQTVGGGMMALLGRGTTVDPEQGVGINGMLKRLQHESKSFEDRVRAAGLQLPDISKGETFQSANPGKDVSEFENVEQETKA